MKRSHGTLWKRWNQQKGGQVDLVTQAQSKRALVRILVLITLISCWNTAVVAQEPVDTTQLKENDLLQYKYNFAEGLRNKMLGKDDQAMIHFETCLDYFPDSTGPSYELATLHFVREKYDNALIYAKKAWEGKQNNVWYGQMLAETYVKLSDWEDASDMYGLIYELKPEEPEYLYRQINLLEQGGLFEKAISLVEERIKDPQLNRWASLKLHLLFRQSEQEKKGERVLKRYLSDHPDDVEARGIYAEYLAEVNKFNEADEQYKLLCELAPENPAVRFSYAQFLFEQGRREEALGEYKHGFASGDVNPAIKIHIVMDYLNQQEQQDSLEFEVVELIEALYDAEGGLPEVDGLYANYLYNEGRFSEAEPIYERLLANSPGNFMAWQNQLFILNELQKYDKMLTTADGALEVFPNQPLLYLFKGVALIDAERWSEAVDAFKSGLRFPGVNSELTKQFYISLGDALYQAGQVEEAFGYFEDLLSLEPDHVVVLNNYSYYLALRGERLGDALQMIQKCIELEPDNPTYLDTYAWVLYKSGMNGEAIKIMERVLETDPDPSAEVYEHAGDIFWEEGFSEKARQYWEKALEKEPERSEIKKKIEKSGK